MERERLRRQANNARERFDVLLSVNIETNNARERFVVLLSVNIEANNAREVCCPAVCKPTLFSKRLPIFEKLTSHNFFFFNLTPGLYNDLRHPGKPTLGPFY